MNENHTQVRNFERYFVMLTSGQFWWNHIDRETSRGFRPSIMKAMQRETLLKNRNNGTIDQVKYFSRGASNRKPLTRVAIEKSH